MGKLTIKGHFPVRYVKLPVNPGLVRSCWVPKPWAPNPEALSAALTACAVAIAWSSALRLFAGTGETDAHGSARNALLGALAAAKRWEMAMELMPQVEMGSPDECLRSAEVDDSMGLY